MSYSLSNEHISLRAVEHTDLDTLYLLENEICEAGSAAGNQPVSRMLIANYIDNYSADIAAEKQLRLMIVNNEGTTVGAVDISDYDAVHHRGFVGISVLASHRGKRYGSEALAMLCRYAADSLGMHQLAALVAVDNETSRRLFSAAGFKAAGRLRSWLKRGKNYSDVLVFQKLF